MISMPFFLFYFHLHFRGASLTCLWGLLPRCAGAGGGDAPLNRQYRHFPADLSADLGT
jgi:hypothetical protein